MAFDLGSSLAEGDYPILKDIAQRQQLEQEERQRFSNQLAELRLEDPLEFPEGVMAGVAGEFAKTYAAHLEAPVQFFYFAFLTCLGSLISERLSIESELSAQPRLFVLLLGESADDRKSTAISKAVDFFKEAIFDFKTSFGVGSAEGLAKKLETDKHLLLCFDEFKQFVSKCKIEASVLLACVCTLFESNRYESKTKTTDVSLHNVHLSLLAASTIQTYERTWDASFTDIGFNNRLFIVPGTGERRFSIPERIREEEKQSLKRQLGSLLERVGQGLTLPVTEEAREIYHQWYTNGERSVHAKRLDAYALRFMPLLALNELKGEVDAEITNKVLALLEWQLAVRKMHDPIDADSKTATMEIKIRRQLATGPMGNRDLKRAVHADRAGVWLFGTALDNLRRTKEVAWDKATQRWVLL